MEVATGFSSTKLETQGWYYLTDDGQTHGPFDVETMKGKLLKMHTRHLLSRRMPSVCVQVCRIHAMIFSLLQNDVMQDS